MAQSTPELPFMDYHAGGLSSMENGSLHFMLSVQKGSDVFRLSSAALGSGLVAWHGNGRVIIAFEFGLATQQSKQGWSNTV
jgi:hypothetical protein